MSVKLPGATLTDLEYEELARYIGSKGDILAAIKARDVPIADKIVFRCWFMYQADQERAGVDNPGFAGPAIG